MRAKHYAKEIIDEILTGDAKDGKRNHARIDIRKYPLERYVLTNKNIYKEFNYLNDVTASSLYEMITGKVGCEVAGLKYESEIIDALLSNNKFKLVYYINDTDSYEISFDAKEANDNYTIMLWDESGDILAQITVRKRGCIINVTSSCLNKLHEFLEPLNKFTFIHSACEIGLFFQEHGNTCIKKIKVDPVEVDVALNYGSEFVEKHNKIVQKLTEEKKGLYIFHGPPAGGKTSYIKYLAQQVDRLFVFIPTGLIDQIDSPSLVSILLNHENPILILEDAEKAVTSRENNSNPSLVSTLLNLSDGILSSMLGVSLIVTFNVNKDKIDKALVRKGRLMVEHEFGKLSVEESNKLAKKLGKEVTFDEPQMLGDIYNVEEKNFHEEKETKSIGFLQNI